MKFSARMAFVSALSTVSGISVAYADEQSNMTVYGGMLDVDNGFEDRTFAGAFINLYSESNVGLHIDLSAIDREDSGQFGAIGASFQVGEYLRPKFMVGTSTESNDLLPELYAFGSVKIGKGPFSVMPGVAYREYKRGESVTPFVDVTNYFSLSGDPNGYYAIQLRATSTFNDDKVSDDGWSVGGGVQTVRYNGLRLGIHYETGRSSWDVSNIPVNQDYHAVRPTIGFAIGKGTELFLRGDFTDTDNWKAQGAMIGIKVAL